MMKRMMKAILMCVVTLVVAAGYVSSSHAEDVLGEVQFDRFMTALAQVDAKEEPDNDSETLFSYDAGATVYVTGETEDGWYIVSYQGQTGYINKNTAQQALTSEEIDVEALDEELEALQVRDKIIVEEVERYRVEARRSRIWGTVIVLLVVGILAVGIISTVRVEKKNKGDGNIIDLDKE